MKRRKTLTVTAILLVQVITHQWTSLCFKRTHRVVQTLNENLFNGHTIAVTPCFVAAASYGRQRKHALHEHRNKIKDVIRQSVNLPVQLLPTTYASFERQKHIQDFWNTERVYEKRNLANVKKCIRDGRKKRKESAHGEEGKNGFRKCGPVTGKEEEPLIRGKKKVLTNLRWTEVIGIISNEERQTKDEYKTDHNVNQFAKSILHNFEKKKKKKKILLHLYRQIYHKIRIIHDGPPYANNDIHIGHILNKIIKDIYLKYLLMKNYCVMLIHGFDTHGLPIEYQVMKMLNIKNVQELTLPDSSKMSSNNSQVLTIHKAKTPGGGSEGHFVTTSLTMRENRNKLENRNNLEMRQHRLSGTRPTLVRDLLRREDIPPVSPSQAEKKIMYFKSLCKSYASHFINEQFMSLVSYGIWGLWDYTYVTFYKLYEDIQRAVFRSLLEHKHIYVSNRPIYHSYATQTVLSDSEIIYKKRICNSFYFYFDLHSVSDHLALKVLEASVDNELVREMLQVGHHAGATNHVGHRDVTERDVEMLRAKEMIQSKLKVLVFTTQMYTIFNNKCLLIHAGYAYDIVKVTFEKGNSLFFLICEKSVDMFLEYLKKYYSKEDRILEVKKVLTLKGKDFEGCTYVNFVNQVESNFVLVTKNEIDESFGSGIVHVAPAHGFSDYNVYYQNNELRKVHLGGEHYEEGKRPGGTQMGRLAKGGKIGKFTHIGESGKIGELTAEDENVIDENDDLKEEYAKVVLDKCNKSAEVIKRDAVSAKGEGIAALYNALRDGVGSTPKININQEDAHLLFYCAFYEHVLFHFPYEHLYTYDWRSHTSVQIKSLLQMYVDIEKIKENKLFYCGIRKMNFVNEHVKGALIKTIQNRNEWCISRQKYWGVNIPLKNILIGGDAKVSFGQQVMDVWFDSSVSYLYVMHMCKHILFNEYLNKVLSGRGEKKRSFALLGTNSNNDQLPFFNMYDVYNELEKANGGKRKDSLLNDITTKRKIFDPEVMYQRLMKRLKSEKNYFKVGSVSEIVDPCRKGKRGDSFLLKDMGIHLCCEGVDQLRGWFQSFFFIYFFLNSGKRRRQRERQYARQHAKRNRDSALPISNVIVHNYVVDANNVKLSKSLNNVISPRNLFPLSGAHRSNTADVVSRGGPCSKGNVKGRKAKAAPPSEEKHFNADIVRLWVCCYNFVNKNVSVSHQILEDINKHIYLKLYNTLKFLLNNLHDLHFSNVTLEVKGDLQMMDQFILYKKEKTIQCCLKAYSKFQLQLLIKYIMNFVNRDLAAYIDYCKDRLYVHERNSISRRNCQMVLYNVLVDMLKILAPVVPHLCEDVYRTLLSVKGRAGQGTAEKSLFLCQLPTIKRRKDVHLETLFLIKYFVHKQMNEILPNSLEAVVYLYSDSDEVITLLKHFLKTPNPLSTFNNHDDLRFLFNVSNVVLCKDLMELKKMDPSFRTYKIPLVRGGEGGTTQACDEDVDQLLQGAQAEEDPFQDMLRAGDASKQTSIHVGIGKSDGAKCAR
ncbi:hypothetical protein AK88_02297 [Plasmodium fragile]|uniref:Isoleucine--tRNA ligase n=1 Tax=Plasmodium fragile TaxID=5857 RepID=A0A0D9QMJ7_PLAFR|nr:uncharacterized protein AK88_02297 [Plasmodium fragile]KJP88022.1 hypothetical protein AK88_02297 [Plasmodium fragile]